MVYPRKKKAAATQRESFVDTTVLDDLRAEAADILARSEEAGSVSDEDQERFETIESEVEHITAALATQDQLRSLVDAGAVEAGSIQSATARPAATVRDQAMRQIERGVEADELPAHAAEKIETMIARDGDLTAKWAITAGSPAYRTAFAKLVGDSARGHLLWTAEEQNAYREVDQAARAMQIDTGTGSYALPISLDPAVILTNDGSSNPLRRVAKVVQITGSEYRGITSAGVTASWLPESQEAADASPTLGQPVIKAEKGAAFVPFSMEFGQDAIGFMTQLRDLLVDGADQLQAEAFMLGTGTDQPRGLITALVAAGGSVIVPGTGEALNAADFYAVQNALGARHQSNAQWVLTLATINGLRQMETTSGAVKFPSLDSNPPTLLGRTVNEASFIDGTINPAATESNYVAVYGDLHGFTIVDRIGTTVEPVQHLFGAANRPTGERGAFMTFRTGSDVTNPAAMKLLRYNTTA